MAAVLALSLGLKIFLTAPGGRPAATRPARTEALRQFLVANVGPVEPVATGWRYTRGECRVLVFPSGERGAMDMAALSRAGKDDRIGYVYRGRVTAKRPAAALAFDVIAYYAAKPFRGGSEPSYVVVIARHCPAMPDLPWSELAT